MSDKTLKLYGTTWCMKSANLRNYLQSRWVDFQDYNVEEDENAAEEVKALYDGVLKFPTLIYGDEFLKNPSISELDEFLEQHSLLE